MLKTDLQEELSGIQEELPVAVHKWGLSKNFGGRFHQRIESVESELRTVIRDLQGDERFAQPTLLGTSASLGRAGSGFVAADRNLRDPGLTAGDLALGGGARIVD